MDVGEGVAERSSGPVAGDSSYFATGEELADCEVAPIGLRDQQAAEIDIENVVSGGGEAAALGFEEVADVAGGAAVEADLGEGGRAPNDVGFRERMEVGRWLEPDRLLGITVVVPDAAVAVGAAVGHEAGAGEGRAIETAGRPLARGARTVARDWLRRGGGRDREQAGEQEGRKRDQRYAGFDVSSSVIRVKN
jgi:hypothetical protein